MEDASRLGPVSGKGLLLMENEMVAEGKVDEHASSCPKEERNDSIMACQWPKAEQGKDDSTVNDKARHIGKDEASPLMMNLMALAAAVPECPVSIENPVIAGSHDISQQGGNP